MADKRSTSWVSIIIFVLVYLVLVAIGFVLWALAVWGSIWAIHAVGLPMP